MNFIGLQSHKAKERENDDRTQGHHIEKNVIGVNAAFQSEASMNPVAHPSISPFSINKSSFIKKKHSVSSSSSTMFGFNNNNGVPHFENGTHCNRYRNGIGNGFHTDVNYLLITYTFNLNSAYYYLTSHKNGQFMSVSKAPDTSIKSIDQMEERKVKKINNPTNSSMKRRFFSTQTDANPESYLCLELLESEHLKSSQTISQAKIITCYFSPIPLHVPSSSPLFQIDLSLKRPHLSSSSSNEFKWGFSFTLLDNMYLVIGSLDFKLHASNDECIHRNVYAYRGLLPGDTIISFNHRSISSYNGNLNDILHELKKCHEIYLRLVRSANCISVASQVFARECTPLTQPNTTSSIQGFPVSTTMRRINFSELHMQKVDMIHKGLQSNIVQCSLENTLRASIMAAKEAFELIRYGLYLFMRRGGFQTIMPKIMQSISKYSKIRGKGSQYSFFQKCINFRTTSSQNMTDQNKAQKTSLKSNEIYFHNISSNYSFQNQNQNQNHYKPLHYRNVIWFLDTRNLRNETLDGSPLYDDNDRDLYDMYEDGTRSHLFLDSLIEEDYSTWLDKRKQKWKKSSKRKIMIDEYGYESDNDTTTVQNTKFWELNHHPSFQHWLIHSTAKWKRSYSWHKQKRRKLEKELEEVVHFPNYNAVKLYSKPCENSEHDVDILTQWQTWLRIRKNQWRIMWRKRQRKKLQQTCMPLKNLDTSNETNDEIKIQINKSKAKANAKAKAKVNAKAKLGKEIAIEEKDQQQQKEQIDSVSESDGKLTSILSSRHIYIDSHIEDEENQARKLDCRPPLDISFLFYSDLGAPDDVVAYILSYLPPSEHWRLLCINYVTSEAIKQRTDMWRNMCPNHWILPKRPRKPWHLFYITNLRKEEELKRKQSDDVMLKASRIIDQGDNLKKLERLIRASEKKFRFHIDYVSDVVLERNSLLNLSVIHKRNRITKWLIETKNADIESFDRGDFTPLLNAAYAGNRYLVRYLLGKKADRTKIGMAHYSKRLSHPDFKGLTAEGWARKRGHTCLADFIKLGLS